MVGEDQLLTGLLDSAEKGNAPKNARETGISTRSAA
jgi:hypothetical protein